MEDRTTGSTRRRYRALAPGHLLASTALQGLLAMGPVLADDLPRFEMQAVRDVPGGRQIARGQYAAAVTLIAGPGSARRAVDPLWLQTNLCVAYTKLGKLDAAKQSCDTAVELAISAAPGDRLAYDRNFQLALVHSNRAVALWAAGDQAAAQADIEAALAHVPSYAPVKANAAALAARSAKLAAL